MAVLLFIFWVVLNGRLTLEIAVFGVVLSAALYAFVIAFFGYKPRYDWLIFKNLPLIIYYFGILICEIAKANLVMAGFIFNWSVKPEPVRVTFTAPLKTAFARVLLANSITLTPGTITMTMNDGNYTVHCYDRSMAEGLDSSVFVTTLMKLEERLK